MCQTAVRLNTEWTCEVRRDFRAVVPASDHVVSIRTSLAHSCKLHNVLAWRKWVWLSKCSLLHNLRNTRCVFVHRIQHTISQIRTQTQKLRTKNNLSKHLKELNHSNIPFGKQSKMLPGKTHSNWTIMKASRSVKTKTKTSVPDGVINSFTLSWEAIFWWITLNFPRECNNERIRPMRVAKFLEQVVSHHPVVPIQTVGTADKWEKRASR